MKRNRFSSVAALAGYDVALLLNVVTPAGARAASSAEERLAALESQVRSLRTENQELRRELGLDGKAGLTVVKPAGREPVLSINGLVQGQAEFGDRGDARFNSANDRIFLRRVRLGAAGRFLEEFDFKVEAEFANSLGGGTTGASGALTDAFLNWSHFPGANVRIGQFKTPYGAEFLAPDPRLLTPERSLGSDRLTLSRQVGVQVSGDFFDKQLSYAAGLFNGNGLNLSANDNENFNYVGRLSGVAWQGRWREQPVRWTVGIDGYTTHDRAVTLPADFGFTGNSFNGRRHGAGFDTQLNVGRFDFSAEYLRVNFEPLNSVPVADFSADAWYAQAAWFLVPKAWQAVVRFETYDPRSGLDGNETGTWTFSVNWLIKGDDLKLQCDYLLSDVPAPLNDQGKLILRAQVIF